MSARGLIASSWFALLITIWGILQAEDRSKEARDREIIEAYIVVSVGAQKPEKKRALRFPEKDLTLEHYMILSRIRGDLALILEYYQASTAEKNGKFMFLDDPEINRKYAQKMERRLSLLVSGGEGVPLEDKQKRKVLEVLKESAKLKEKIWEIRERAGLVKSSQQGAAG